MNAPYVRFYAGTPLVTDTGEALGTLCVVDPGLRQLSPEQMAALQALARVATQQLSLRRQVMQLEEAVLSRDEAGNYHIVTKYDVINALGK